jgi:hypothetical protein
VVADLRAEQGAIAAVVSALEAAHFEVDGMSPDGLAHRYVRPAEPTPVKVDVLAPEGLGATSRPDHHEAGPDPGGARWHPGPGADRTRRRGP